MVEHQAFRRIRRSDSHPFMEDRREVKKPKQENYLCLKLESRDDLKYKEKININKE